VGAVLCLSDAVSTMKMGGCTPLELFWRGRGSKLG